MNISSFIIILGIFSLIPIKKLDFLKRIVSLAFIALVLTFISQKIINVEFPLIQKVTITALDEKNQDSEGYEVWVKGAVIDGKWHEADEVLKKGNWIKKDDYILIWRNYDLDYILDESVSLNLPYGNDIDIIFDSNKWRGKAKINIENKKNIFVDVYSDSKNSKDLAVNIPFLLEKEKLNFEKNKTTLKYIVFIILFILLYIVDNIYYKKNKEYISNFKDKHNINERVFWIDLLRVICVFTIVLLHCTCNVYYNFTDNIYEWYNYLYMNCFTAFAVPCFFMISGVLSIRENIDIRKNLKKIWGFFIQLFFWSLIYILFRKYFYNENISLITSILKIPLISQGWQLWFMYHIISIYFLLPLISFCYFKVSSNLKNYTFILIFIIPSIITTISVIIQKNIDLPLFSFGFPSLGMFLLGKVLYESKYKDKKIFYLIILLFGYICMVTGNYIISIKQGRPINAFIGSYGTVPVILFSVGVFGLFMSFSKSIDEISDKFKKVILFISKNSMGIYFSHIFVKDMVGNLNMGNILISSNFGNNINMILGTILYFVLSLLVSNIISKSYLLKKILLNN